MSISVFERFRPDLSVDAIQDINLQKLAADGYDTLLIDMDNTLLPWQGLNIPDTVRAWVAQALSMGFKLCIVSNTHNPKRLRKVAEDLSIQSVFQAIKPRRRGFLNALDILGSSAENAVVIGDQLLTDIWGGRRCGIKTILVHPIHHNEFLGTKLSRLVERVIISALRRRGNN